MSQPGVMASPEDKSAWAEDAFAWFAAYLKVGFTDEQALRIVVASVGRTVVTTTAIPPEFSEMATKMNALLNNDLAEQ